MFSAISEIRQLPVLSLRTLLTENLMPSKGEASVLTALSGAALVLSGSALTLSLTELAGALDAALLAVLEELPPQAVKPSARASSTIPARIRFLIFIV